MENQEPATSVPLSKLQWKWVIIGVAVGAVVVTLIVGLTTSTFHNIFIQSFMGCIGFMCTGIIVGYFSPGVTIREAAMGGAILAIFFLLALLLFFGQQVNTIQILVTIVFGYLLAFAGGWVGENLQQDRSPQVRGMQWRWVAIGVIVGVVLNSVGVFAVSPLLNYNLNAIGLSFLLTFVVAGFIVGFFSPGVTIKEAALAGVFTVIVDWVLVFIGLGIPVSKPSMLFAMTSGFFLSLLGAWFGERLQASMQKQKELARE